MRKTFTASAAAAALAFCAALPARAEVVLTYDSLPSVGPSPTAFDEDGYRTAHAGGLSPVLLSIAPRVLVVNPDFANTDVLISRIDGAPFSLLSIDFFSRAGATSLTVFGDTLGGGTVSTAANIVSGAPTVNFGPGFSSLVRVRFAQGDDIARTSFQFDNVRLDTPAASVPEPTTLALAAFGLAGAALARRRRVSAAATGA